MHINCFKPKVTDTFKNSQNGFHIKFVNSDGSNTILSNIERTPTFSSIVDRTRPPYFWLRMNKHQTSNLIGLSLDLLNFSLNWLEHHFFKHRKDLNVFIYWYSNSNTIFLAMNDHTLNLVRSITIFDGYRKIRAFQPCVSKSHKVLTTSVPK